jgi:raffinose/stachyose/melibiose transport system substrate-binding protein
MKREDHVRIGKLSLASAAFVLALGAAGNASAAEVRFWTLTFDNDAVSQAFQTIIADFEKANPGITIKIEHRSTDEHKAALRVAGNSDQAPDVYFMWAGLGLGGEFVKSGLAADMGKYYDEYKWNDRFISPSLAFSKQYPGGTFGVPYNFHGETLYYSKALFAKAGIASPPTTWAELDADADKLVAAGTPPITFGGTVNWHVMRIMDAILEATCGTEKNDGLFAMKLDWSKEECATKSFQEFHNWTTKYFLKPFMGIDNQQAFNLFLQGRAAMMLEGDWFVDQLRGAGKNLDDYATFQIPTGTGRLYGFGEYNYISTKSKIPDAAAKFLDYLESDEVQQKNLGRFGALSVNKNVKYDNISALNRQVLDIFASAKGLYVNGDQAFPLAQTTEYWRIINEVASDNLDPAKAAAEMQAFIAAHPAK